jgi:hypothetical protein
MRWSGGATRSVSVVGAVERCIEFLTYFLFAGYEIGHHACLQDGPWSCVALLWLPTTSGFASQTNPWSPGIGGVGQKEPGLFVLDARR